MAGKARVHELAKELGVTSKQLLETLNEQGEFVKSASSTVEAPVARRIRKLFAGKTAQAENTDKTAEKTSSRAKPAAAKKSRKTTSNNLTLLRSILTIGAIIFSITQTLQDNLSSSCSCYSTKIARSVIIF